MNPRITVGESPELGNKAIAATQKQPVSLPLLLGVFFHGASAAGIA